MKTPKTHPFTTPTDERSKKVAAIKAVLHGSQPIASLKEYRKMPEWAIYFTLVIFPDGSYECVEFDPTWNWYEEPVFLTGDAVWVKMERFKHLEELWQQTPAIDKIGSYWSKCPCDECDQPECRHDRRIINSMEQINGKLIQNMSEDATDTPLGQLPSYEQFLGKVSGSTHVFTYTMHIDNELCESQIQPLWNTKDNNPLVGQSVYDTSKHESIIVWNDPN